MISILTQLLTTCIVGFRPLLGPASCYFEETCTPFALRMLQEKPLPQAMFSITTRLLSCNPFNAYVRRKKLLAPVFILLAGCTLTAQGITDSSYVARQCNPETIRNSSVITAFLNEMVHTLGLTPKKQQVCLSENGFSATQLVQESGSITVMVENESNTLYLKFFLLTSSLNKNKDVATAIKKYFHAQSISTAKL